MTGEAAEGFGDAPNADAILLLARGWELRGEFARAEQSYRRCLAVDPDQPAAHEHLADLLRSRNELGDAEQHYRRALAGDAGRHGAHKGLIETMRLKYGFDAAFASYGLEGDGAAIGRDHEIVACTVVRNERLHLDDFLRHHRSIGIDHFLFIDNGSTDGTWEHLVRQADVTMLRGNAPFRSVNCGSAWFELALRRWRPDGWTLLVDADERFVHPLLEHPNLHDVIGWLEAEGSRAMPAILLDMYGEGAVDRNTPTPGVPFIDTCPYFDVPFFHRRVFRAGPYRNASTFEGGVRTRVFGSPPPLLSKVPLVRYGPDVVLTGGQHFTNLSDRDISEARGCLLHLKYLAGLHERVATEVERGEHFNDAEFYKPIADRLRLEPEISMYTEGISRRYLGPQSLLDHAVMERPAFRL